MFLHPLANNDPDLTQDFMLVKIALLLADGATDDTFTDAMRDMDEHARTGSGAHNAFLFIYTLARFHVATDASSYSYPGNAGQLHDLPHDVVNCVANVQGEDAWNLWKKSGMSRTDTISHPDVQTLAIEILHDIRAMDNGEPTADLVDYLPDRWRQSTP